MQWNVRGKTILITGATNGIGLQASIALAQQGARVVMVGRDRARTEAAVAQVVARRGPIAPAEAAGAPGATGSSGAAAAHQSSEPRGAVESPGVPGAPDVSYLLCDFSSQADVRRLAAEFRARHDRLDVLVNNAGGVNKTRLVTRDGIEMTWAVNHLGYFLLTTLLEDLIVRSAPGRIVTVASVGHRQGTLDFDDLGFTRGYSIMRAYSRSKLANVLFAAELARRLAGTGVTSNSLHPGAVDTAIWSGAPVWAKPVIQLLFRPFFFISAERGGANLTALVTRPDLAEVTGKYFEEARLVDPSPLAQDQALARRLWDVSAAMVAPHS